MIYVYIQHIYLSENKVTIVVDDISAHKAPHFNSSSPEKNGRQCIFLNENDRIQIWISLQFVPRSPIDNKSALGQVMAWCRQASSHHLNQCWPRSVSPYGVPWPQWVKYPTLKIAVYITFVLKIVSPQANKNIFELIGPGRFESNFR